MEREFKYRMKFIKKHPYLFWQYIGFFILAVDCLYVWFNLENEQVSYAFIVLSAMLAFAIITLSPFVIKCRKKMKDIFTTLLIIFMVLKLIDFHAPEVQAVLDTLLKDKSTGKNIIWATDPPEELQTVMYEPVTDRSQITTQQLGLTHYEVVLPRMMKQTDTQQQRTRKKGEVFSPAWVCNKMNNALDADWFGGLGAGETAGQFTVELPQGWQTVETPVQFPVCKGRTPAWVQYVQSRRLEVTCGEAPFLASRYDAATGEMIPVARRIGILDRKLRVVSENAATEDEWRKYATHAVQSTYGYEYQGDNLLLARVNLLLTYAEHLQARWQRKPTKEELQPIATIISWNLWQAASPSRRQNSLTSFPCSGRQSRSRPRYPVK